jgi:hypothetical protein
MCNRAAMFGGPLGLLRELFSKASLVKAAESFGCLRRNSSLIPTDSCVLKGHRRRESPDVGIAGVKVFAGLAMNLP